MTERLTSADPIEAWRRAAERAENPATWRVGEELRGRGSVVGFVREQGRVAVLIHCPTAWGRDTPRWVSHHTAAREWRRYGVGPDDIDD